MKDSIDQELIDAKVTQTVLAIEDVLYLDIAMSVGGSKDYLIMVTVTHTKIKITMTTITTTTMAMATTTTTTITMEIMIKEIGGNLFLIGDVIKKKYSKF